ncbi:MAG: thiamine diphosphokinase [Prevotellaceae bacterium]|jgi:thiamine pyrophosphokinase|nr:thiamine diphosphokinase [Prevotellaceae bacterium]
MLNLIQSFPTAVLAHGGFPAHRCALQQLRRAATVVCCDGAAESLLQFGMEPTYIVGDLDSIAPELKKRFADRICHKAEQESNDLTKSINFCREKGYREITILGATGKREDHTLGNISLLAEYAKELSVQMLTDYGALNVVQCAATFESFAGQQASICCLSSKTRITTEGLKYPLVDSLLPSWWMGTLNEALGDFFTVHFSEGSVLVFREYPKQV